MSPSPAGPWVVFTSIGRMGHREVCTQLKWQRMTTASPNLYILIRDNISTEAEAERLARTPDRNDLAPHRRPAADLSWLKFWLAPEGVPVG